MNDVVYRQAAIRTVKTIYKMCDTGDIRDYRDMLVEAFNVLPSAQPGWIPVTERLPKPEDEVLLTMDYKGRRYVEMGNIWSDGTVHSYIDEYLTPDGRKYRKVVAWMPMPKPWKGR